MKALSELGISPWPWKADEEGWVDDVNGVQVITNAGALVSLRDIKKNPDASLIAAAPELYEACLWCLKQANEIGAAFIGDEIDKNALAMSMAGIVRRCDAALAKASGEESRNESD